MSTAAPCRARFVPLLALLLAGAVAACDDGPTQPGVYSHEVDGVLWAAVKTPRSLPTVRTWLPYLRPSSPEAESALRGVRALQADADALRREGRVDAAQSRETEAALRAVGALTQTPPAQLLILSLASLQTWAETAADAASTHPLPQLRRAADDVRQHRSAAMLALERGDTTEALSEIVSGSALARGFSPAAVALRAVTEAERSLADLQPHGEDAQRAVRLLRHAREAVASGDDARALRRALYALQLAENTVRSNGAAR